MAGHDGTPSDADRNAEPSRILRDAKINGNVRNRENHRINRDVEFTSFSSSPPHSRLADTEMSAKEVSVNPLWDSAPILSSGEGSDKLWRIDRSRFESIQIEEEKGDGTSMSRFFQQGRKNSVSGYYEKQKEMIQGFSEMDALEERLIPSAEEERASEQLEKSETFAINLSNITNIFLLVAKVVCSVESGSLSIIASTLDSLLDLLSGFILWFTAKSMKISNPYRYPIGKKRMQPLGIIVFASIMATLGLQILFEGIRQLIQGKSTDYNFANEWQWIVGVMVSASVVKLFLFLYCSTFTNDIVRAYATDHFFDVVTNVIGLAAALLARKYKWWIDPVGAILLALYTMKNWGSTVLEHVNSLTGQSAPPEFLQKLTYLCWNHHEKIIQIDTVRAYTFGSHYFVEVDIVLPEEMPLRVAHDIGESLQNKLERVPEIERAFVHLDFEVSHKPEHHQVARFRPTG